MNEVNSRQRDTTCRLDNRSIMLCIKLFFDQKTLTIFLVEAIIVAIYIVTFRLHDNDDMVALFSFGGTITSILLAVIAIFYSFIQSNESKCNNADLITNIRDLQEYVETISEFSNKISVISSNIEDLNKQYTVGFNELRTELESAVNIIKEDNEAVLKSILAKSEKNMSMKGKNVSNKLDSEELSKLFNKMKTEF